MRFTIFVKHPKLWLVASTICLLSPVTIFAQSVGETACVNAPRTSLRAGPSFRHRISWQINQNMPLKIIAQQGTWLKVEDLNQDRYWILARMLSNEFSCVVIAKPVVHLRQRASHRARAVLAVEKGTPFRVFERQEKWLKLDYYQQEIWVHESLVWPQ